VGLGQICPLVEPGRYPVLDLRGLPPDVDDAAVVGKGEGVAVGVDVQVGQGAGLLRAGETRDDSPSERQEVDSAFPVVVVTALGQEQDVFDDAADREMIADFDYAGHGLTALEALVGILRHRRDVVSQEYPTLTRRPIEDDAIVCPGQADVLHTDQIELRLPPEEPVDDPAIEIVVDGESDHPAELACSFRRARRRSRISRRSERDSINSWTSSFCC
jgi:hypothetical protein